MVGGRLGLSGLRKKALTTDVMVDSLREARNAMAESKDTLDIMIKTLSYVKKVCGKEKAAMLLDEIALLYGEFIKETEGKTPKQCEVIERKYTKKATDIIDRYVEGPSDLPAKVKTVFKERGMLAAMTTAIGLVTGLMAYSSISERMASQAWKEGMQNLLTPFGRPGRPPFSIFVTRKDIWHWHKIIGTHGTKALRKKSGATFLKCLKLGGGMGAVVGVALFVAPELIKLGQEKIREKKIRKGLWRPEKVVPEKVIPEKKK